MKLKDRPLSYKLYWSWAGTKKEKKKTITGSICTHEGLNKNLSKRNNTTMNDMECRIYYTELVQLGNCRESNGRLLPLCVWYKAEAAAGLRTSAQRKD